MAPVPGVVCAFDSSPAGRRAIHAATAYCRENGASLFFLPVVRPGAFEPAGPGVSRRVRQRNAAVAAGIVASRTALELGVDSSVDGVVENGERGAIDLAIRRGAGVIFVGESAGGVTALFRRRRPVRTIRVRRTAAILTPRAG